MTLEQLEADLDEVIALSDQICAIVGGRLSPAIPADRANAQILGLMMAGDWSVAGAIEAETTNAL